MQNFLQYTNITIDDIVNAVNNKLSSDPKFANFRETAIAQTMIEIFAGIADIQLYNLQRRAEESFPDTARLKSSVILLSKLLGYSVQRPIPSEAKIYLKLKGDLTNRNIVEGDVIQIPIFSKLTYDDLDLLFKTTFQYTFTNTDITEISTSAADYEKEISLDDSENNIFVLQGTQKTKIIEGSTNTQIGQIFQKYKIEDTSFSNKFGSEDYDTTVTNVWVGNGKTDNNKYLIDRRSLINWDTIELFLNGSPIKVCLLKTSTDENIELVFGDAKFTELGANLSASGPNTTYDNIYIDYLSTKGLDGNRTGIINEKLSSSFSVYVNGDISKDITSNTEFYFYSNLVGGADMESIDEIRNNAPNIFYTMDRLVSSKDYINYLKSLSSPINIKNAIAWGEQEEMEESTFEPIVKLFNVAMFCALGSMYNLNGTSYGPKENLEDVVFDLNFDEDGISDQSYWNLYMNQSVVKQLKYYETSGSSFNIYGDTLTEPFEVIKNQYDGFPLMFELGSPYFLTNETLQINTSAISLSATTSFNDIATLIENALVDTKDLRGTALTNTNYNKNAFSGIDVSYDSVNNKFTINNGKDSSCHLNYLGYYGGGLTAALGFEKNSVKVDYTSRDNAISDNLVKLINIIGKKSQLTLRNVYMSPIIQKFNLNGKIYVKQLADKEDLHRQIKNSIYSWLDVNADFNIPIYKSNITQLIEQYPSVLYADVSLDPYVPSLPIGKTQWYNPYEDIRINKAIYVDSYGSTSYIDNIIISQIWGYLSTTSETITEPNYVYSNLNYLNIKVQEDSEFFINRINERTFYTILVKNIYNALPSSNPLGIGTAFRDSQDFIDVMSDIHKDLIFIIRYNMLDSKGNIVPENKIELINGVEKTTWARGGYSMKTEIVKIIVNTTCLYK